MLKGMPEDLFEQLDRLANLQVESFQQADWLISDFERPIWKMRFGTVERTVDWRVPFGSDLLTHPKHTNSRNLFKSFVIAQTHPSTTAGRVIDGGTAKHLVAVAFRIIDYFLLRQDEFKLPVHGFRLVTANDISTLLYRIECGGMDSEAIYDWRRNLSQWLDDQVRVSREAVQLLAERHPFFSETTYPKEEWILDVEPETLALWRAVMWKNGMYARARNLNYRFSPATRKLAAIIYAGTLSGMTAKPIFEELCLYPVDKYVRERPGVDVRTGEGKGATIAYVKRRRAALMSMSTLGDAGFDVPIDAFETALEYKPVHPERIAKPGRYRNPPIWQVMDGIRNGTEFTLDYGAGLFESYVNVLRAAREERVTPYALTLKHDIRQFLTKRAIDMGVTQWCLRTHAGSWSVGKRYMKARHGVRWDRRQFYTEFRNRRGLLQNIQVFYGGVLHVLGPVAGRRQTEILRLPVIGCLDESKEFIVFENGKSGAAGLRQEEFRPIPPVISLQVSLIEDFHKKLVEAKVIDVPGMLLGMPGFKGMRKPNVPTFNDALDAFSDFFEVPLSDVGQRHYLREHQFRRFLIIAFFFGARQSNLETLRWFIGHTDVEHLWHYLTNSISGEMHREAAVYFILDELRLPEEERVIEIHDKVRYEMTEFVRVNFGVERFSLVDADALENYLKFMLEKNVIVEPEFFSAASGQHYKIIVRLRGGEMNLTYEPRTKNEKAVAALAKLIEAVVGTPREFVGDEDLLLALKRQSRLGKYSRPSMGVAATSRCTIVRIANRMFEGGFSSFNELRLMALSALLEAATEATRPRRRTKEHVENELDQANIDRVRALVDCWHVTNAFHRALKEARTLANLTRDPVLVARWDKTEEMLLAMFDLAERPVVRKQTEAEEWLLRLRY